MFLIKKSRGNYYNNSNDFSIVIYFDKNNNSMTIYSSIYIKYEKDVSMSIAIRIGRE